MKTWGPTMLVFSPFVNKIHDMDCMCILVPVCWLIRSSIHIYIKLYAPNCFHALILVLQKSFMSALHTLINYHLNIGPYLLQLSLCMCIGWHRHSTHSCHMTCFRCFCLVLIQINMLFREKEVKIGCMAIAYQVIIWVISGPALGCKQLNRAGPPPAMGLKKI